MGLDLDRHSQSQRLGWLLPAAVIALALLFELGGTDLRQALRYSRDGVADGDLWRLASGHFVHLGWRHFLMNGLALLVIWMLVGQRLRPLQWLLVAVVSIACIDAGFWWRDSGLQWYVGMSGLLHGLLLAGLLAGWRQAPVEAIVISALLVAKLGFEQWVGPMPGSAAAAGGPVVVNAHLYGAIGGLLAALLLLVRVPRFPPL